MSNARVAGLQTKIPARDSTSTETQLPMANAAASARRIQAADVTIGAWRARATIGCVSPDDSVVDRLRAVVGDAHVLLADDLRAGYETDWTGRVHGLARAVIRPADADEVQGVVAICAETGTPIVPQGGNTGLVGGSVPRGGEVVLSFRRLAQVAVDGDRGEAVVGAGAVLDVVQTATLAKGWELGV